METFTEPVYAAMQLSVFCHSCSLQHFNHGNDWISGERF